MLLGNVEEPHFQFLNALIAFFLRKAQGLELRERRAAFRQLTV
jgi:hypothetical protein